MTNKILFTFDDQSRKALEEATETGGFRSMAETVRTGLVILRALQRQSRDGYKRVLVSGKKGTRELVIPDIG
jgi:Arc/MetJ-type ribon-helix-helix transcriptional regulator